MRFILVFLMTLMAPAGAAARQAVNLADANLEDLLKMEVRSVSKKEQQLFRAAAAVYVLTNEEIRRSGVTTIPDALRLVPGVQVAQIDANKWAVSARGFNSLWSNKLLVLVDGRVVYTPVSSGVYWDVQDVMLADLERIEVVRGPGAAVWGANAVNGVINIITKSAAATKGVFANVETGTLNPAIAAIRYGGNVGAHGSYRAYVKHASRGSFVDATGADAQDDSRVTQVGFRTDLPAGTRDLFSIQGAMLRSESGQRVFARMTSYTDPGPRPIVAVESPGEADHLLARWTQERSSRSSLSAQFFVDRSYRFVVGKGESTRTIDVEFQHRLAPSPRHDIVWGAGHRWWSDTEESVFGEYFDPASSDMRLLTAFVQDEIAVVPNVIDLTIGSKFEHNTVSGVEAQPSARLAWTPSRRQTVWAAVSRAARTPSRTERALRFDLAAFTDPNGQLTVLSLRGNADIESEHLVAFEAGYRFEPRDNVLIDIAAFRNRYSDLQTENMRAVFETTPEPPHLSVIRDFVSGMRARSAGIETLVRWQIRSNWRLDAGYDWMETRFSDVGTNPSALTSIVRNPEHQARIASWLTIGHGWELDASLSYTGALKGLDVPAYARAGARLGGPIARGLNLSVIGQNLLDSPHAEFAGFEGVFLSETRRSISVRLRLEL